MPKCESKIRGRLLPVSILAALIISIWDYPLFAFNDPSHQGNSEIKLLISPVKDSFCLDEPVKLKVVFENTSGHDIFLIDPEKWQICCLFFYIRDPLGKTVQDKPKQRLWTFANPEAKLVLIRPGARIEFYYPDIRSQYFDQYHFVLNLIGEYQVYAEYVPARTVSTKDGKTSYSGKMVSDIIAVKIKSCK